MATKKSFAGTNPALMFITAAEQVAEQDTQDTQQTQDTYTHTHDTYTDNTQYVHNTQNTPDTPNTSPAAIVRNTQHTQYTHNTHTQYTPDMHTGPESKSKRLNLLIRPSLHAQAQKIAHMQQTSVNDIINISLARYIQENKQEIGRYDALFGEKQP